MEFLNIDNISDMISEICDKEVKYACVILYNSDDTFVRHEYGKLGWVHKIGLLDSVKMSIGQQPLAAWIEEQGGIPMPQL